MRTVGIIAVVALVVLAAGCQTRKSVKLPITGRLIEVPQVRQSVALAPPPKMIGCAWDYGVMPPGLVFEVWASTNLTAWVLATNTVEKNARFPIKPCEFYQVRARDARGQVSAWATTGN